MRLLGWRKTEETGDPRTLALLRERIRERLARGPSSLLLSVGPAILEWNRSRGAGPGAAALWPALREGRALVVLTGQQPALAGGPLYTLYKLASAVALARRLEAEAAVPVLPVFWIVGDDSDFGEVSSAWIPGADGNLARVRDAEVPPGGTLIGGLPASRQINLLRALIDPSAQTPGRGPLSLFLEDAGREETWSDLQASLFFRLFPESSLVVVDGAQPELLRAQSEWLREAAGWPLEELLKEGAGQVRERGMEPALEPALGSRAMFRVREGRRDPLAGEPDGEELLAPNVVLRPLLQDLLLPNLATVCGPSEIQYRAQLGPLYRRARIPEPACLPRLRALLLPELSPELLSGMGERPYEDAAAEPDFFWERLQERSVPPDLRQEVEQARRDVRSRFDRLGPLLAAFDPGLKQLVESAEGKADFQLQRIEEGLSAKARHRLLRKDPALPGWRDFIRPRGGEQERTLCLLTPYLSEGDTVTAALSGAAEAHVNRLLAGDTELAEALFLLEGRRGPGRERSDG